MAKGTCSVEGCDRGVYGRNWCGLHYQRWRKTGDPMGLRLERPSEEVRFWSKVQKRAPLDCWDWLGPKTPAGYGIFFVYPGGSRQVHRGAHRFSYELSYGPIPEGLVIDHLCRRPSCVNPAHLEVVTQQINVLRSVGSPAQLNAEKTHCKRGHEFTAANTYFSKEGRRSCRRCGCLKQKAYQERKMLKRLLSYRQLQEQDE